MKKLKPDFNHKLTKEEEKMLRSLGFQKKYGESNNLKKYWYTKKIQSSPLEKCEVTVDCGLVSIWCKDVDNDEYCIVIRKKFSTIENLVAIYSRFF